MGERIELLTLVPAQKQVGLEKNMTSPTATPLCKQFHPKSINPSQLPPTLQHLAQAPTI